MAFCVKCGAKIPDGAAFCPSCGASQQSQQVAATQTKATHKELATVLMLIGGFLGLAFALSSLVVFPFFAGMMNYGLGMMGRYDAGAFRMIGFPQVFGGIILGWIVVAFVGSLLAIYSGFKLRQDYAKNTAILGIVGGVLLLITFSWFPGLVVLAGSILAYTE